MEPIVNHYYLTTEINKDVVILEDIPKNNLSILLEYNKAIIDFRYFVRKLKEIDFNYSDFKSQFNYYEIELSKKAEQDIIEINHIFIDLNRLFVNFITSIRVFIEHLEIRLIKKYSKDSDVYKSFKQFTGNCYNKYFSYRLFYHLRNFAIHIDYPINSFFSEYEYDSKNKINRFEFKVDFQKSHLLKDRKIKSKLKTDLELFNDKFPVNPLIEEILLPVSEFLPFVVNLDPNHYILAAETLNNFLAKYKKCDEISISRWTQVSTTTGKWHLKIIPTELIRIIIENKKSIA